MDSKIVQKVVDYWMCKRVTTRGITDPIERECVRLHFFKREGRTKDISNKLKDAGIRSWKQVEQVAENATYEEVSGVITGFNKQHEFFNLTLDPESAERYGKGFKTMNFQPDQVVEDPTDDDLAMLLTHRSKEIRTIAKKRYDAKTKDESFHC